MVGIKNIFPASLEALTNLDKIAVTAADAAEAATAQPHFFLICFHGIKVFFTCFCLNFAYMSGSNSFMFM